MTSTILNSKQTAFVMLLLLNFPTLMRSCVKKRLITVIFIRCAAMFRDKYLKIEHVL